MIADSRATGHPLGLAAMQADLLADDASETTLVLPRGRRLGVARTERGLTVRKTPGGRWRGVVKSGREQVASNTFDTRHQATSWVIRERATLAGGVDPAAGRCAL
jgi:hypothetical protein